MFKQCESYLSDETEPPLGDSRFGLGFELELD